MLLSRKVTKLRSIKTILSVHQEGLTMFKPNQLYQVLKGHVTHQITLAAFII